MGDGCLRSDRDCLAIHLMRSDKPHLIKFAEAINLSNYRIEEYDNACRLSVAGKWFPKYLGNHYGIHPRKTASAQYPNLPLEMNSHFIRGLFDSDGCITCSKGNVYQVSFNGTQSIVSGIRQKILEETDVVLKSSNIVPPIQHKLGVKSICYSGRNALRVTEYLYKESSCSNWLDRKRDKFELLRRVYAG